MTSKEMFENLGYGETLRSRVDTGYRKVTYANSVFEIGVSAYEVYKFNHILREVTPLTPAETVACAKLIFELNQSGEIKLGGSIRKK